MTGSPFLHHYLPYVLRQADQTLSAPFYAVLAHHEVSRSEWRVLAVVHELGQLTVADLAAAALSPQPTVTHALHRLEQRGLVTRTPGVDDKRQRFISVTKKGTALANTLVTEASRLQADALADVGDLAGLIDQLNDLTHRVAAHLARATTDTALAT